MCLPNQLLLVLLHRGWGHVEHHHLHIQLIDYRHLGNGTADSYNINKSLQANNVCDNSS